MPTRLMRQWLRSLSQPAIFSPTWLSVNERCRPPRMNLPGKGGGRGHSPSTILVATPYTLRRLLVIPDLSGLVSRPGYPLSQVVFSAGSLAIGLIHLARLRQYRIGPGPRPQQPSSDVDD
ncbi:MAG: hypothetical protein A2Z37_02440 [Chloroflexi bacterium RBG_19FT_COMBO_62_14]|nr:MAG: hypothetical protein A2Z37_02440 [Chloroflexi bacterium RBG_19FT_COMBO_62_14]